MKSDSKPMQYSVDLPDEWSEVSDLCIKRDRPDGGTPTILRVVESVGADASSVLSSRFYIINESSLSADIVDSADDRNEAKRKLIEAAHDHY